MKNTINKAKREQLLEDVGLRPDVEIIGHLGQRRNISQDMGKKRMGMSLVLEIEN